MKVLGDEKLTETELGQWLRFAMFIAKMFDNPNVELAVLDDHDKEL